MMMARRSIAIGIALLAIAAGVGVWLWPGAPATTAGVVVAGGDGGGLPRATPEEERFQPAALEAAIAEAQRQGARAFLVMRHGHLVAEYYRRSADASEPVDAGGFAGVLAAIGAGVAQGEGMLSLRQSGPFDAAAMAEAIAAGSGQSYAEFLSQRVWQPMNAADARVIDAAGSIAARISDWLRVAALLLDQGRFEGADIVAASWVQFMRQPSPGAPQQGFGVHLASAAVGAEPFAADGVFYLRGRDRWRLWMVPELELAVLFAGEADGGTWDETLLPNQVIRAITDRGGSRNGATSLQQLVPGH
jgi:hypothetical protein